VDVKAGSAVTATDHDGGDVEEEEEQRRRRGGRRGAGQRGDGDHVEVMRCEGCSAVTATDYGGGVEERRRRSRRRVRMAEEEGGAGGLRRDLGWSTLRMWRLLPLSLPLTTWWCRVKRTREQRR
jgi:hypothetical protein